MDTHYHLPENFSEADRSTISRIIERIHKSGLDHEQINPILENWMPSVLESADPVMVMVSFERYVQKLEPHSDVFRLLIRNTHSIEILQKVFSSSRYLSEVLIRNPTALITLAESLVTRQTKITRPIIL